MKNFKHWEKMETFKFAQIQEKKVTTHVKLKWKFRASTVKMQMEEEKKGKFKSNEEKLKQIDFHHERNTQKSWFKLKDKFQKRSWQFEK